MCSVPIKKNVEVFVNDSDFYFLAHTNSSVGQRHSCVAQVEVVVILQGIKECFGGTATALTFHIDSLLLLFPCQFRHLAQLGMSDTLVMLMRCNKYNQSIQDSFNFHYAIQDCNTRSFARREDDE